MNTAFDSTSQLAIDTNTLGNLKGAAKQNSPEALKQAAKQFEALLMNMMLKSMRDASPQEGIFDSEQTKLYTSMLDQQLSQTMANKGMGFADMLVKQLSKNIAPVSDPEANIDAALQSAPSDKKLRAQLFNQTFPYIEPMAPKPEATKQVNVFHTLNHDMLRDAFEQRMRHAAQQASDTSGIPAHFMVAQAALESGWGKREIVDASGRPSFNLFGIKAGKDWDGKVTETLTTEYVNGLPQKRIEKFRAYDSYEASFMDYAKLISTNPRYEKAMQNTHDAAGFARALQQGGYATDPHYANKLTSIIERLD